MKKHRIGKLPTTSVAELQVDLRYVFRSVFSQQIGQLVNGRYLELDTCPVWLTSDQVRATMWRVGDDLLRDQIVGRKQSKRSK